jgi:hypothetical protein
MELIIQNSMVSFEQCETSSFYFDASIFLRHEPFNSINLFLSHLATLILTCTFLPIDMIILGMGNHLGR